MKKLLLLVFVLAALPCCDSGAEASAEAAPSQPEAEAAAEAAPAEAAEAEGAVAQADGPAPDRYPGLMFHLLDDSERARFVELSEGELCPCETVESLDACLQREDSCSLSLHAGALMMRMVKEGSEAVEITDAVQQFVANARRVWEFDLDDAPYAGAEDPQIVLVNFSDFECPHCREFSNAIHDVLERHGDKVRVYFKQFPLSNHRNAAAAALGAVAAYRQGQFVAFHDHVFANQSALSAATDPTAYLVQVANELGLNVERFVADANSEATRAYVERDRIEGMESGLMSTPTMFFNGVKMMDGYSGDALMERVEAALAEGAEPAEGSGAAE